MTELWMKFESAKYDNIFIEEGKKSQQLEIKIKVLVKSMIIVSKSIKMNI